MTQLHTSTGVASVLQLVATERSNLEPENFMAGNFDVLEAITNHLPSDENDLIDAVVQQCFSVLSSAPKHLRFTQANLLMLCLQSFLTNEQRIAVLAGCNDSRCAVDFAAVNDAIVRANAKQLSTLTFIQGMAFLVLLLCRSYAALGRGETPSTALAIKSISQLYSQRQKVGGYGTSIALALLVTLKKEFYALNEKVCKAKARKPITICGSDGSATP